jgi:LAS superfamily LD-carboxypeptidase LdcB
MNKFLISQNEKKLVESILSKMEKEKGKKGFRVVTFEKLFELLTNNEVAFINKLLKTDLLKYGFKGKFFGIQNVPTNLVEIKNQHYKLNSEIKDIDIQYLPQDTFNVYENLNKTLYNDTGKKLLVLSGYRSPAYQLFLFLWYLKFYKFNFAKTIKRAALPGYSEHGFPERQAIDFMTEIGQPSEVDPLDFAQTVEYQWLKKNAGKFSFYETNPPNNLLGTMYEPWHWAYLET